MLKGERVTLRALEPADAETMWEWYRDREFSELDGNRYGTSLEALRVFVSTLASPSYSDVSLGIEDEGDTLIGIVRLKRGAPEDRRADLGIAIARPYWSRGYGTDATRTILRFAFGTMQLHRVSLNVRADNPRAQRCYEKCGFRVEGRRRAAAYHRGVYVDEIMMGILADEEPPT